MFFDLVAEDDESKGLLSDMKPQSSERSSNSTTIGPYTNISSGGIMSNFHTMSMSFSLNHAVVVTCLAFSSTLLGNALGSFMLGILYICFAVAAFFFSNVFVLGLGSRESLLLGMAGYTIQATAFFVCLITYNISIVITWFIAVPAFIIGGFAAGIIWTAQGRIYRLHAKLYAEKTGQNLGHINSQFAAIFTSYFLGFEFILKIMATAFYFMISTSAEYFIFFIYTLLAWSAFFIAFRMLDLDEPASQAMSCSAISDNASLTGRLLYLDYKLGMLVPFQIAFGFTSSMMTFYILGTVIADSTRLGEAYVGLFSAIVVLAGALMAAPMSKVADQQGKSIVILFGNACLLGCGLIVLLFTNETIGTWLFMVPFSIIFGLGRGVWVS
jgi:hypothetical protein